MRSHIPAPATHSPPADLPHTPQRFHAAPSPTADAPAARPVTARGQLEAIPCWSNQGRSTAALRSDRPRSGAQTARAARDSDHPPAADARPPPLQPLPPAHRPHYLQQCVFLGAPLRRSIQSRERAAPPTVRAAPDPAAAAAAAEGNPKLARQAAAAAAAFGPWVDALFRAAPDAQSERLRRSRRLLWSKGPPLSARAAEAAEDRGCDDDAALAAEVPAQRSPLASAAAAAAAALRPLGNAPAGEGAAEAGGWGGDCAAWPAGAHVWQLPTH
jgi:hypothetical protein